jgi:hypothetical protein
MLEGKEGGVWLETVATAKNAVQFQRGRTHRLLPFTEVSMIRRFLAVAFRIMDCRCGIFSDFCDDLAERFGSDLSAETDR